MTAWSCEAYGPAGAEYGALCFVAGELGARVCADAAECAGTMAAERRRLFQRINELAAAGDDPTFAELADEFGGPDELLGGSAGQ